MLTWYLCVSTSYCNVDLISLCINFLLLGSWYTEISGQHYSRKLIHRDIRSTLQEEVDTQRYQVNITVGSWYTEISGQHYSKKLIPEIFVYQLLTVMLTWYLLTLYQLPTVMLTWYLCVSTSYCNVDLISLCINYLL
jgi:hypothetical protein